jgi:uncharacterized spore protein YtfJ
MLQELVNKLQDTISVRRVFGEPYTLDGVTVIPVATVGGGAGSGSGTDPNGGSGEGGGFAGGGRPVGAYVIQDGQVSWRPAVDVNRVITFAGIFLIALVRLISKRQRRRARQR